MERYVFQSATEATRKDEFISLLSNKIIKNGSFICMEWDTIIATPKKYGDIEIKKHCIGVFRLGIEYSHTQNFKDLERDLQPLASPNDRHLKDYPMIIENIKDPNNIYYKLQVFFSKHKPTSTYTLNGKEITKQELLDLGYIKEYKSTNPPTIFTIKLMNLIAIGKAEAEA